MTTNNNNINYENMNDQEEISYLSYNEEPELLKEKIYPSIASGLLKRLLPKENLTEEPNEKRKNKNFTSLKNQVTNEFKNLVRLDKELKSDLSTKNYKIISLISSLNTTKIEKEIITEINNTNLEEQIHRDNLNKIYYNNSDLTIPFSLYPKANDLPLNYKGFYGLFLNRVSKYIKLISQFNPEMSGYQNISYRFNKSFDKTINFNLVYKLIEYFFYTMSCFISWPYIINTPLKVKIYFFYFVKPNNFNKNHNKFNQDLNIFNKYPQRLETLCQILTKLYKKPVELEAIRVYYSYHDSNILVNIMGSLCNKIRFRNIMRRLLKISTIINPTRMKKLNKYSKNTIVPSKIKNPRLVPAYVSGIKVRVAGRLLTQRVIPRYTVNTIQRGSLARGKANFVNTARFTNKNKNGSYSITITMGHVMV